MTHDRTDRNREGVMPFRERLGWATLFAVPPGVGVALATSRMAVAPLTAPLVVATGVGTTAILFALVFGATSVGDDRA